MIAAVVASLDSVALGEMGNAELLDRIDTKYLLPAELVPELLEDATTEYRVLTFDGRRISRYRTEYFDTPSLTSYRDHITGRSPRFKVRIRTYLDEELSFLEIKLRTSRGRTVKVREPYRGDWAHAVDALATGRHAAVAAIVPWAQLRPSMQVDYSRLTLVSRSAAERVTLDLRLAFKEDGVTVIYPGLAIAEVKQQRASRLGLTSAMRRRGIREASISKYCVGIARLRSDEVRTNGYRWLLERMNHIGGADNVVAPAQ